jgi:hypothetical protein
VPLRPKNRFLEVNEAACSMGGLFFCILQAQVCGKAVQNCGEYDYEWNIS